ncbi:hypothetical protein GCM10022262_09730 [Georgenia daeguensis]|uniref:Uncharacterized protein n=1 Tax=Georgenia daeguensis TaxID=908355 RepID=A0ABP8ERH3_9MICO
MESTRVPSASSSTAPGPEIVMPKCYRPGARPASQRGGAAPAPWPTLEAEEAARRVAENHVRDAESSG